MVLTRGILRGAFRLSVCSPERIPSSGPLVVVANHESLLDGFVVGSALPHRQVTFLSAAYLFEQRIAGSFLRAMGALPVERESSNIGSMRRAIAILRSGGTLGVFPGGGIDTSEMLDGAVYLAVKATAPVLVLNIRGAREALPLGRMWPLFRRITVYPAEPFRPADGRSLGMGTREAVREGTRRIAELLRQA